jgi:hypothetical protein
MNDDKVPAGKYAVSTPTGILRTPRAWFKNVS